MENGKWNGKGTMDFNKGDVYDGDWKDDIMHGLGVYYWKNGNKYNG